MGLWLISGLNRIQALLCGILAFGLLAVVSGWLMLQGTSDCGCLGKLPTHPALMFVVDAASAASLVMALSLTNSWQDIRHGARQVLMTATVIGVLALAGAGYAVSKYGSLEATARSWRGDVLDLPRFVETNKPGVDGLRRATVPLRNLTDAPIRITGSDACCGARVETTFPHTVEAGAEDTLVIVLDCETTRSRVVTVWVESESKLKKQRVVVSCPASE